MSLSMVSPAKAEPQPNPKPPEPNTQPLNNARMGNLNPHFSQDEREAPLIKPNDIRLLSAARQGASPSAVAIPHQAPIRAVFLHKAQLARVRGSGSSKADDHGASRTVNSKLGRSERSTAHQPPDGGIPTECQLVRGSAGRQALPNVDSPHASEAEPRCIGHQPHPTPMQTTHRR